MQTWRDQILRGNVGNHSKTPTEVISIRFIVNELTPSSEEAKAKVIKLKSNYLSILSIFSKKLKLLKACKNCFHFILRISD